MSGAITYRKFRDGDEADLVDLCSTIYGIETNVEYWQWKYSEGPVGLNASFVAEDNGRVVGMAGSVPYRLQVNGKELVGGQLTDLMTHPEWRKQNVFLPIMRKSIECVRQDMDLMYGFTNEKSFRIYARRLKYDIAYTVPRLDRVVSIKPFLDRKTGGGARVASAAAGVADNVSKLITYPRRPSIRSGRTVNEAADFDARFDRLWERVRGSLQVASVRDSKYLTWRYSRHPIYNYTTFCVETGDEIDGFVTLRYADEGGIKRGYIMDLVADPSDNAAVNALVSTSIRFFMDGGADLIRCWSFPHAPYHNALKKKLFFKTTSDLVVLTTSFNDAVSNEFFKDPNNWYIQMGDCDSF